MTEIKLIVVCLALSGCASSKPILRTADEGARIACELFFASSPDAEKSGKSVAEYAKDMCEKAEVLRKFYRPFLSAQQLGKAGATPEEYEAGPEGACKPAAEQ